MPRSSLRTLTCVSVAFFVAAACTSLYDTDDLTDSEQTTDDGDGLSGTDAALDDRDAGEDGRDSGTSSDADIDEPDAAAECRPGQAGQDCNQQESEFFECNDEGECEPCGQGVGQACCETEPICDGLVGLVCSPGGLCI